MIVRSRGGGGEGEGPQGTVHLFERARLTKWGGGGYWTWGVKELGGRQEPGTPAEPVPRDTELELGASPLGAPQGQDDRLAIWSPASGAPIMSMFMAPPRVVQQGGPGTEGRQEAIH